MVRGCQQNDSLANGVAQDRTTDILTQLADTVTVRYHEDPTGINYRWVPAVARAAAMTTSLPPLLCPLKIPGAPSPCTSSFPPPPAHTPTGTCNMVHNP